MLESLRCPSCSTHYGLRPERVQTGIRRAKCFRCSHVFGIEDVVARLLPPTPEPVPAPLIEEVPGLAAGDLAGLDLSEDLFESPVPGATSLDDSLCIGDLEDSGEELERTLVDFVPPPPDPGAEPHYASARDAINRLLGDAPPPTSTRAFPGARSSSPMDVEATLEALETTLGGVLQEELAPEPTLSPDSDTLSTVRMTMEDMEAALQPPQEATDASRQTLSVPITELIPPTSTLPLPEPVPVTVPVPQDPNLLKLRIGEDLYESLSTDQIATWVEQGRVLENHLVARQFSDNWIEASKVPALRPVFERIRRLRSILPEEIPAAPAPESSKRSLFGGLFGRN
nr:zinc-ribbon domain-containing protein [uncultured Holophaga sp.]